MKEEKTCQFKGCEVKLLIKDGRGRRKKWCDKHRKIMHLERQRDYTHKKDEEFEKTRRKSHVWFNGLTPEYRRKKPGNVVKDLDSYADGILRSVEYIEDRMEEKKKYEEPF